MISGAHHPVVHGLAVGSADEETALATDPFHFATLAVAQGAIHNRVDGEFQTGRAGIQNAQATIFHASWPFASEVCMLRNPTTDEPLETAFMTKFGLAQSVRRVEDPRLLNGGGRYTDDIVLPGMLHGVVLRSPHAAAKLGAIDTAAARSVPGVKAIYTAADLNADGIAPMPCAAPVQNRDGSDMASPPHPALADGAVRHVGDPVAFIVADTAAAARDAAELIAVDYAIEPAITDIAHCDRHRRAAGVGRCDEERRVRLGNRRQGGDRCAVCHGGARHAADRREQPGHRRIHGGARRDRRLRFRLRPLDALRQHAGRLADQDPDRSGLQRPSPRTSASSRPMSAAASA